MSRRQYNTILKRWQLQVASVFVSMKTSAIVAGFYAYKKKNPELCDSGFIILPVNPKFAGAFPAVEGRLLCVGRAVLRAYQL